MTEEKKVESVKLGDFACGQFGRMRNVHFLGVIIAITPGNVKLRGPQGHEESFAIAEISVFDDNNLDPTQMEFVRRVRLELGMSLEPRNPQLCVARMARSMVLAAVAVKLAARETALIDPTKVDLGPIADIFYRQTIADCVEAQRRTT